MQLNLSGEIKKMEGANQMKILQKRRDLLKQKFDP
jgi:hypothetical protein